MQAVPHPEIVTRPALVARTSLGRGDAETYLQLGEPGLPVWVTDPESATAFASLREAMRAATRLPAHHRAFAVPQGAFRLRA